MKVAFLLSNFPPETYAGTELVAEALAESLRARGADVTVVCCSDVPDSKEPEREERRAGMRVVRLFRRAGEWDADGFRRPRLLARLRELLVELAPDVVHAHSTAAFGAGPIALCAELGLPAVVTFHDLWVTCPRYFRLPPAGIACPPAAERGPCAPCVALALATHDEAAVAAGIVERDRAVRADVAAARALAAPSETAARLIREHLPWNGPIRVVPHGVLRPAVAAAPPPRPDEPLRIGTFGNLVAEKGVAELVEAAAGLACELHLFGPFLDEAFGRSVQALAAARGVALRCHGRYGPADPHPARTLHLAAFPSKCQETYGLVVDEALAHGVPVLASDRGALRERAGPGVATAPLEGFASALRALATDPARLAALRAAIPAKLPAIGDAAAQYAALYDSVRAGAAR